MTIEVTVYYALLLGSCGVECHNYRCEVECLGTAQAIVQAMQGAKHQERYLLSDGSRRIHWERAFWRTKGEKGYKETCLSLLNQRGLSEVINH